MAVSLKKVEKWTKKKNVKKLLKALTVNDKDVRIAVITALGTTKDEGAMNSLILLLSDPNTLIRGAAIESLGNMGIGRSLEFIRQFWNNETDEALREKARTAVAKIKENMTKEERNK